MSSDVQRVCTTCVFCLRQDYGYSNYTVEGTTLSCLRGLNDDLDGSEEPYRMVTPALAKALDKALTCEAYRMGAPVSLDVDLEGWPYEPEKQTVQEAMRVYGVDEDVATLLLPKIS